MQAGYNIKIMKPCTNKKKDPKEDTKEEKKEE